MKRVRSKLAMAVIAVAAIVLIGALGASAYWSVQYLLTGNQFQSGHMSLTVTDLGQTTITPLTVSGMMPQAPPDPAVAGNKKIIEITSDLTNGAMLTDLAIGVSNVDGIGTLKDNVKVAIALTTAGSNIYWLEPAGAESVAFENTDLTYADHAFVLSDYDLESWSGMTGYVDMASGQVRHVAVYYYLPSDCSNDCHDSTATFDMSFELLQS